MIRLILLALVLAVGISGAAVAGPFEDGVAAYGKADYATALRLWRPLADLGDADAQINLGVMYANGEGVPQDYAQAVAWYRKAADQGIAEAQNNLGVMYANGQGVPHDYEVAVSWYRKAANQGYVIAQDRLGSIYFNGLYGISKTVRPDYVQAHMWYNLAAAQENFNGAAYSRDQIAARMTPAQIAEAQRLAREWKPKLGK